MTTGRHIDWKLIFSYAETTPKLRFTCVVELAHPFRGYFLIFDKPEAFGVSALSVGPVNQLVSGHVVPAVTLHRQPLILPVGVRGTRITLEAVNIEPIDPSKLVKGTRKVKTHLVPTPFRAELHGKILLGSEDDTPLPSTWEGPVVDDRKLN